MNRDDLIRLLEAELDLIRNGGYGTPTSDPHSSVPCFRGSVCCINHWVVPGHLPDAHEGCVLMEFVPEEHREKEPPCHFIPLNEDGETVHSLEEAADRERLEKVVAEWLEKTIAWVKDDRRQKVGSHTEDY